MKIKTKILKISTNEIYSGKHWRTRNKHKQDYLWLTSHFKELDKIDYKVDIRIDFYFRAYPLDSSNCSYMAKMLEDCLVHYGILTDDTIKYVEDFTVRSHKDKTIEDDYAVIEIKKTIK